jgi:hypothetical protein
LLLIRLVSLFELLAAPHNALRMLPTGLVDLKALLHLDLSHNQLGSAPVAGWADLAHLKALRVLTLSHNNIAMALNEFYAYILAHLKKSDQTRVSRLRGQSDRDLDHLVLLLLHRRAAQAQVHGLEARLEERPRAGARHRGAGHV